MAMALQAAAADGPPEGIHSLGDIPRVHSRLTPHQPAIAFESRTTTYQQLDERASQVANGLIASGVKPGDRVAHLGKNSDLYLELLLGAAKAGAVMTPVNWRLAPREFAYIINDCEAKVLFVGPEFIAAVEGLAEPLRVGEIIGVEAAFKGRSYVEWRDAQPTRDPQTLIKRDSAAVQLYTSGTTGNPKGAVLTHRNLVGMPQSSRTYTWSRWSAE
jgi:acyl-CoA synthetase (AMP-forming)/AMP-acid ligase II